MEDDWRSRIVLRRGDIADARADAIVNAANNDLVLGAGVAGAIRRKGGPSIQHECDRHGPIRVGEAAITGAGALAARYVIHAASMRLGGRTTAASLSASVRDTLRLAGEHGLQSIAFPAIGTGVAGFPVGECARIMLDEVRRHLRAGSPLKRVEFVLFDAETLAVFEKRLAALDG